MKALLIFPHQLDRMHPALDDFDQLIMVEAFLYFRQYTFHKQKIAFHRASMKSFERALSQSKHTTYLSSQHEASDVRKLIPFLHEQGYKELGIIDPVDDWLMTRIETIANKLGIRLDRYESTLFINSHAELANHFKSDKVRFFQTTFYKSERRRLNLLLTDSGAPVGGQWTYDADNRKKYPKSKLPPPIMFPEGDAFWQEAVDYTNTYFPNNPGELDALYYPYTPAMASQWFDQFLNHRFAEFGPYEDAIVRDACFLNHSVLTPMLNVGLICPLDIVERSIEFANINQIPIQSVEGFVRQITGWREFIRGMYLAKGRMMRTRNYWGFSRKIPDSFYLGTTGIEPIDQTIKKVLRTGYCHHIERLMILGNFMVLCEFDPDEVYRWFMELFIDAYDWVMVPNVYGMSQFADGGSFATKPYISGSNYILKMSDYGKGSWQIVWDGLFWNFMNKRRDFFSKNPRLSMLVRNLDRMPQERLNKHLSVAQTYLNSLDVGGAS